ncbi:tRNA lysidine(34) synthetase TilS [Enterococcus sp.]|jgi:tRNA(Ile)-lysidine synthase|uniref:tRNA lysidine(34) synthetase TilS n=1 Tax=Enterococcus sp. TaxID=35783 RepID=UPI0025B87CEE|nr:tRNA lysidine(34) synthetase TilS [Enterococcus sp.]
MLKQKVYQAMKTEGWGENKACLLAVSTGVDSMVLLHVIERLFQNQGSFGVAHVNHRLREASNEEAMFLREYCQVRGIPYYERVWQNPPESGIEAAAREFRYRFFAETMTLQGYDWLLTAHHADDQMETMLMKMIREGRLQNASGIKRKQSFEGGELIRPLLTIPKADIREYAQMNGVIYFEDESNQQTLFQRNRLRHQVVPLLKAENPRVLDHFQQLSQEMIYADQLIKKQQEDWFAKLLHVEGNGYCLDLNELQTFTTAERYYFFEGLLQKISHEKGFSYNTKQREQLLALLEDNPSQWGIDLDQNWQIVRTYQRLKIIPSDNGTPSRAASEEKQFVLKKGESLFLSDHEWIGYLPKDAKVPEKVMNWSEISQILPVHYPATVFLRKRKPGDRLQLKPGLTKKISRFFIDKKISNEKRAASWVMTDVQEKVLALLPYLFSYLSIEQETDKIHYILLYKYRE